MKIVEDLLRIDSIKAFQLSNILRQGSMLIIGIVLARYGYTTQEIGNYEYILFYLTTASFFWLNGIIQYYMTNFSKESDNNFEKHTTQLLILFSILSLLIISVLHWSKFILFVPGFFVFFGALCVLYIPSMFIDYVLLVRKMVSTQISLSLIFFLIQMLGLIVIAENNLSVENIFKILIFISLIKWIFLIYITKSYQLEVDFFRSSKQLFWASLPLIGYFIVTGSAGIIDGWIIKYRFSEESMFAIYKYGARDLPVIGTLAIGLSGAMLPLVSESLFEGMQQIKTRSAKLMHMVYPILIIMVAFSNKIFPFVFNSEFKETALIFSIFSFVVGARFLYPHTILTSLGENRFLLINSIVELTINIVSSLILSYYFGLAGIAMGTVIAYLYEKIAASIYLFYLKGISLSDYTPVGIYAFYNTLLAVIFVISHLN